ncbi:MAG: YceI family protein [Sulfuricurvum sp.]|nr:YceI family protein [Sulfuricurvum sp.]MDD5385988.1 YceI family protein [Sulfuricurvum sp.]
MKKASIAVLALVASMYAGNLSFESGAIKAHTEVFGDATIDPTAKRATSHLVMEATPLTLKGTIEVSMSDLISDNKKRDEHMQEALESDSFPKAVFDVKEVVAKGGNNYTLKGTMNLHGVTKPLSFDGTIIEEGGKVHIKTVSTMKMTDFGIKPIKMVFLTVRDQVDLTVDISLKR